jgi:hypothetical protein
MELERNGSSRSKSSYRVTFESEKSVISKEIGDLETIRGRLGLSRRKICQILMVDPSAWTRWTRTADGAPPHVYRMLEWYLLLKERHPTLAHQYYERLSHPVRPEGEELLKQEILHQLKSSESRIKTDWSLEVSRLQSEIRQSVESVNRARPVSYPIKPNNSARRPWLIGVIGFLLGMAAWGAISFFAFKH